MGAEKGFAQLVVLADFGGGSMVAGVVDTLHPVHTAVGRGVAGQGGIAVDIRRKERDVPATAQCHDGGNALHVAVFGKGSVGAQPLGITVDAGVHGHAGAESRPERQPLPELKMVLPCDEPFDIDVAAGAVAAPTRHVVDQKAVAIKIESSALACRKEGFAGILVGRKLKLNAVFVLVTITPHQPEVITFIYAVAIAARLFHRASYAHHQVAPAAGQQFLQCERLRRFQRLRLHNGSQQFYRQTVEAVNGI